MVDIGLVLESPFLHEEDQVLNDYLVDYVLHCQVRIIQQCFGIFY